MDDLYIKKVLNGDVDAFRYFVHQYKDQAFNIALSVLKNEFDAREAVQEAYIIAFRKLSKYRGRSKFSTWFFRIVINESLKFLKKNRNTVDIESGEAKSAGPGYTEMDDILGREQQKFFIDRAMKRIASNEALVLTLFYMQDYSIEEIKDLTGWTVSNTKVLLHRARKSMYGELNKELSGEKKTLY